MNEKLLLRTLSNKFRFFPCLLAVAAVLAPVAAYAAGGGVQMINYYDLVLSQLGLDSHTWAPVMAGVLSLIILTALGLAYRSAVVVSGDSAIPDGKISVRTFVESILDFIVNLAEDVIGHDYKPFLPLLCSLFLFIFVSNLMGLIPGFPPATESMSTNLAMGFTVFLVYNFAGIKSNGIGYLKHFLGPVWWLAPLLLLIELISHVVRPISLSLRLYGNIFGDHLVLSVFSSLVPIVLPSLLLFFGLLVATLQSFVFTLLTSIYISIATSHDH